MAKKRAPTQYDETIESAADSAFGSISDLKDELESWYDNLPENFQSGDKGDQLQDAISNLENCDTPEVPECLSEVTVKYSLTYKAKMSRADRCSEACYIIDQVVSACEEEIARLQEMDFNEDGKLVDAENVEVGPKEVDGENVEPMTEDERDNNVSEIEQFKDECDSAKSEWENTEFPRMFG